MTPTLDAITTVTALGVGSGLRDRISKLEQALPGKDRDQAAELLAADGIGSDSLLAALTIKAMAGQINVVVHTLGILVSLPYILKPGEVIESLSLGAGNTGRTHDLETDLRVAEFKFINWRGGAEAIRQNTLFVDLFNLANSSTSKQREMYVVGKEQPLRFLNNNRSIRSVLSKHSSAQARFDQRHSGQFTTVHQYWVTIMHSVDLIDLKDCVPAFGGAATEFLDEEVEPATEPLDP
jgi:hypothetical protein